MTKIPSGSKAYISSDAINITHMQEAIPDLLRGRPLLRLGGNANVTRVTSRSRSVEKARDLEIKKYRRYMNSIGTLTANEQVVFEEPKK